MSRLSESRNTRRTIRVQLSFRDILVRLGAQLGGRARATCPVHRGSNPTSLSFDDARGVYHCFACGSGGDKIDLAMQALGVGFNAALGWLGVENLDEDCGGESGAVCSMVAEEKRLQEGLEGWAKSRAKALRKEYCDREGIECHAMERLRRNPDDELAWNMLEVALVGKAKLEYALDHLDGDEADRLRAFRFLEGSE